MIRCSMTRDHVTSTDLWKGADTGPGKRWRVRVWDPVAREYASKNVNTPEEGDEWAKTKQAKFTLGIERSRGDKPTAQGPVIALHRSLPPSACPCGRWSRLAATGRNRLGDHS